MTYPTKIHTNLTASDDTAIPSVRLYYNPKKGKHDTKHEPTSFFISGPIPFVWMQRANALPGKAGSVGISLWFLKGLKRSLSFVVTAKAQLLSGCSRQAFSRGLIALANANLILLQTRPGARPIVEIIPEDEPGMVQISSDITVA